MLGRSFNSLLSGRRLGTNLRWARAHKCPCTGDEGDSDPKCGVCKGRGRYYDAWSEVFKAGFIGQDASALAQALKQMGAGADIGDAVIVIPLNAPCFADINHGDRIQVVDSTDTLERVVIPGSPIRLPDGYTPLKATVRAADKQSIVEIPFPTPAPDGRVSVSVPTTLQFRVGRMYEVSPNSLPKVRPMAGGQPKRVALSRIDWTTR